MYVTAHSGPNQGTLSQASRVQRPDQDSLVFFLRHVHPSVKLASSVIVDPGFNSLLPKATQNTSLRCFLFSIDIYHDTGP